MKIYGVIIMKLVSIQIALFTSDLIGRPDLLMNEINERLGGVFDAMPTILNLPPDVPAEIPLAQIRSNDNIYALNVSRSRTDLIISPHYSDDKVPSDSFKTFKPLIEKFYRATASSHSIKRVGVIFTLFEAAEENVKIIYEKYLKEKWVAGNAEITIRTNQQTMSKGIIYNNIRNIQAADLHVEKETHKGVIIQLDTNNVPTNDALSLETIAAIVSYANNKLKAGVVKELI